MPFTTLRIKYLLLKKTRKPSLTAIAEDWGVRLEELSMCIRQVPDRIYPELRIKISEVIGHPVEKVFGSHPLTTALLNPQTETRSAA
jgi:hypothetical protein